MSSKIAIFFCASYNQSHHRNYSFHPHLSNCVCDIVYGHNCRVFEDNCCASNAHKWNTDQLHRQGQIRFFPDKGQSSPGIQRLDNPCRQQDACTHIDTFESNRQEDDTRVLEKESQTPFFDISAFLKKEMTEEKMIEEKISTKVKEEDLLPPPASPKDAFSLPSIGPLCGKGRYQREAVFYP